MSFEKCLDLLISWDNAPTNSILSDLCNLTPLELKAFAPIWANVPLERRFVVMEKLVGLSQSSPELDFNTVFHHCLEDGDQSIREKAIEGLWDYEDRLLIPRLCSILEEDSASSVRTTAAIALGKFAALAQNGKLLKKDITRIYDCLISSLTNAAEDLDTRRRCLEAAAIFNTDRVVEFIRWAYNSAEIELQCSSIYAMGRTGESSWLEILFREMKSPNPPLRYEAANACAEIEDEEAIVHLIPLTEDEDLQVQLASIRAIGTIGGPLAKKALRRCIKSGDPVIESTAIDYLEIVDATDDLMGFRS